MIGAGFGVLGGAAALGALTAAPAHASSINAGFWSYGPLRVADSRTGLGTTKAKIRGGQRRTIPFTKYFGTGHSITAVLNLTVTETEGGSFLTLWETGRSRPNTSNINWWGANQTYGNLAVAGLRSSDVSVDVYCGGTTAGTHFVLDLLGYYWDDNPARTRPPVELRS